MRTIKKLNLNDKIKVKLNPLGAEIFYNQHEELIEMLKARGIDAFKNRMPQIDNDGYTEMQLWYFMELYGQHIGMGKPNILTDLSLYIDDKYLEEVSS